MKFGRSVDRCLRLSLLLKLKPTEIWTPPSWGEFRREYRAGRCKVSFDYTMTRKWAYGQGWGDKKPYIIRYSLVAIIVALVGVWLVGLLFDIPIEEYYKFPLTAGLIGAGFGWVTGFRKSFVAKLMSSEENFRLAYRESGIDIYRIRDK